MITEQQRQRAAIFHALHQPGAPLVLINIWDAGSAKAVSEAGAAALATGSASVALAHGYDDGENLPLTALLHTLHEIIRVTDLPVSADFETGFAEDHETLAINVRDLILTGVVGLNFEDQIIGGALRSAEDQAARLRLIRAEAERQGLDLFINARTDVFLRERDHTRHAGLLDAAKERLAAYREAGASGLFVPGLTDSDVIAEICADAGLPVNILVMGDEIRRQHHARLGVARISAGPAPYRRMMAMLQAEALAALQP